MGCLGTVSMLAFGYTCEAWDLNACSYISSKASLVSLPRHRIVAELFCCFGKAVESRPCGLKGQLQNGHVLV